MSQIQTQTTASAPDRLTIYYDGSCPLCRAEIGHYRRQDGSDALCFVDVSDPAAPLADDLGRESAMARFHVRTAQGDLISGAAAFARIWQVLPAWRWAARLARVPGVTPILELAYRAFLPVRPAVSRMAARMEARRTAKAARRPGSSG